MKLIKNYFLSKNLFFLLLPIVVFIIAFFIHYKMVMTNQENIFQYNTQQIRQEILNEEKTVFILNFLGNSITYMLQIIGSILILNIGFLIFGYSFSFKKLCSVVIKSSIVLSLVYIILPIILYTNQNVYSFKDLYTIESNYTLLRYVDDFADTWLKNLLEMISITQVLFVLLLAYGISTMMLWKYKHALLKTATFYSVGFIIWACFSITMDLNFYQ